AVAWGVPALVDDQQFILPDGKHTIYLVGRKSGSPPHLAALASVNLTDPVVSPAAVAGSVAYVMDAADVLLAVQLPQLEVVRQWPLGGRCVWGPRAVAGRVLVATSDLQLHCLDEQKRLLWQITLPYGPLAGAPLALDGDYILASTDGVLWRVEGTTGKEKGKVAVEQPLGTGAVRLGDRLVVGGHDGTLYQVPIP
ncbi:MAG TPA: hypothetical protein EYP56_03190, partial [Planctomycetaceae bacterium]|nr:hypothetical protein [Planctomycetaceae bacterium]